MSEYQPERVVPDEPYDPERTDRYRRALWAKLHELADPEIEAGNFRVWEPVRALLLVACDISCLALRENGCDPASAKTRAIAALQEELEEIRKAQKRIAESN